MSQQTLRDAEVKQGMNKTTDAAFDLERQLQPTEATIDAYAVEKYGVVSKRGTLNVSVTGGGVAGVHTLGISIPAGAVLLDIMFFNKTLWNAGTSSTLIIGDTADPDGYIAATSLKATNMLAGETVTLDSINAWGGLEGAYLTAAGRRGTLANGVYYPAADTITAKITLVGSTATTGESHMVVLYALPYSVGVGTYVAS